MPSLASLIGSTSTRTEAFSVGERAEERARRIEAEEMGALWESMVASCLKRSGTPRRYLGKPHWLDEAAKASDLFDSGWWCLWLSGDVGRGKTDYAASVLAVAAARDPRRRLLFVGEADMYDRQRPGGDEGAEAAFRRCDLLVIDDAGKARPTAWTVERLWATLDARYAAQRPTVVTSQLDRKGFAALVGEVSPATGKALLSRLHDGCWEAELSGPDRRLQ